MARIFRAPLTQRPISYRGNDNPCANLAGARDYGPENHRTTDYGTTDYGPRKCEERRAQLGVAQRQSKPQLPKCALRTPAEKVGNQSLKADLASGATRKTSALAPKAVLSGWPSIPPLTLLTRRISFLGRSRRSRGVRWFST